MKTGDDWLDAKVAECEEKERRALEFLNRREKVILEEPTGHLRITVGLPGSGKSMWAEKYVEGHPGTIRVNKDTIRQILHDGEYSREKEDIVIAMRDHIIEQALIGKCAVVCDDTNLHPKHIKRIKDIAERHNATVEVRDFTNVPKEVCIERDEKRTDKKPVGRDEIERMYNDHFENGQWKYRDLLV